MVKFTRIVVLGCVVCPSLMDCAAVIPHESVFGHFEPLALDADDRVGIATPAALMFDDIYKRKHNLIEPRILAAYSAPLKASLDDDEDNYSDDDDDPDDDDEDFAYPNLKRATDLYGSISEPMTNSGLEAASKAVPASNEQVEAQVEEAATPSKTQGNDVETARLLMSGLGSKDPEGSNTAINGISNCFQKVCCTSGNWKTAQINDSFRANMNEFFQRINDTIKENGGMALLEYGDSFL